MWGYKQFNGEIQRPTGEVAVYGYSGHDLGKNNPTMQDHPSLGPIPCGDYDITFRGDTVSHGPYVLELHPHATNKMFGRSGFLMHGDSVIKPGTASLGCIIMPIKTRREIWESGDHVLRVINGI